MEAIYVIQKSLQRGGEMMFVNSGISFATTEEGANEILRDSLSLLKTMYPDLVVLGQHRNWLHITYSEPETGFHMRALFTVARIANTLVAL